MTPVMRHYTYEWWRPDTRLCFYVGKGVGKRAWQTRDRNPAFQAHIRALTRKKLKPIIKITHRFQTHQQACFKESQRILFLVWKGHPLTNSRISSDRAYWDDSWQKGWDL